MKSVSFSTIKGALKRKSDPFKSNGELEIKKKGPTEMERIDQVLGPIRKIKRGTEIID